MPNYRLLFLLMNKNKIKLVEELSSRSYLLLAALLIACSTLVISATYYYLSWYNNIREQQYINNIINEKKRTVSEYFYNIEQNISLIAKSPDLINSLKIFTANSNSTLNNNLYNQYNSWLQLVRNNSSFEEIFLLNDKNIPIYNTTSANINNLDHKTINLLSDLINKLDNKILAYSEYFFIHRIKENNNTIGYLVAKISPQKLNNLLKLADESIELKLISKDINNSNNIRHGYFEVLGTPMTIMSKNALPNFQFINIISPAWHKILFATSFIVIAVFLLGSFLQSKLLAKSLTTHLDVSEDENKTTELPTNIVHLNDHDNESINQINSLKLVIQESLKNFNENLDHLYELFNQIQTTTVNSIQLFKQAKLEIPLNNDADSANKPDIVLLENLASTSEDIIKKAIDDTDHAGLSNNMLISRTHHLENATQIINNLIKEINLLALNTIIQSAKGNMDNKNIENITDNIKQISQRSNRAIEELKLQMQHITQASDSVGNNVSDIRSSITKAKQNISNISNIILSYKDRYNNSKSLPHINLEEIYSSSENITKYSTNALNSINKISDQVTTLNNHVTKLLEKV